MDEQLEGKLRGLKLKKAMQFENIEMLSSVNDQTYTQFGKLEAEIMLLEKAIVRTVENPLV